MKLPKIFRTFLWLVSLSSWLRFASGSRSHADCGDLLTEPRGVITTPNFPRPFTVPIKCRWVIDATDRIYSNGSIAVYLTQLFVYKGLTFTEYAYYESESSNLGATVIKEVTEGNVFEFRWFKTFRPFLVIEFNLDRLEGNHIRVLNDLLDVYGFNITYEMTGAEANPNSCSVRDCSYAGNCIVASNYSTFWCDCFAGFGGPNCSDGPLCQDDQRIPVCQNGATCKHVGAEAVRCHCANGFTGNNCEIRLLQTSDTECSEEGCILQCPFNENIHRACTCRNGTKIFNDRSRFECRIKLSNVTSVRALIPQQGTLEALLGKYLAKYLRNSNISSVEDLKILSVTATSEVIFHFFGNSDDGDKIRESLNRLVQRKRLGEISLESTHFTFQQKPALKLQTLRTNQINEREVRLSDQFILSCVAQGSYNVKFVWFKDGMLVNMSKATREIWHKHLPNDGSDQHTSLLTIDKATSLDAGHYTCQVIDWGVQQCKTIKIEVREEPDVRVIPMSATIEKGGNIRLRCMTPNMRSIGIGFGWSKNRALLKLEPGSEVWEDLYPAGSILKITNAQKSAVYTCNVAQRSMAVRVEVVNRTLIPVCLKDKSWGSQWPDTGPGLDALLECPRNFVGRRVTRLCSMRDATTPEWQLPDFSSCLYEPLIFPYHNFRSLTLGYQNTTGAETIAAYWNVLRSRTLPLYPGEGDRILSLLSEVEQYLNASKESRDLFHSAEAFMRIINFIIEHENSVLSQQKLILLQQLSRRNLVNWANQLNPPYTHLGLSEMVADILPLQVDSHDGKTHTVNIPHIESIYPSWYGDKVAIRLQGRNIGTSTNDTFSGISIVYKNISRFLPHVYVTELTDGTDLEYHINSRVITVDVVLPEKQTKMPQGKILVDLDLRHMKNQPGIWNVSCGMADHTGSWNLEICIANTLPSGNVTHCVCPQTGTFAVFLTARAVRVAIAKKQQATLVVVLGCGSCLLQCLVSSLFLGSYWWNNRTWLNFLKVQCCGALIGAMTIFIYAVHNTLPESSFSLVAICLEAFLLVGMSAPISQALIVYAELTSVRPSQHFQPTVIAVITVLVVVMFHGLVAGVPVLAVLATELAQKSTGWRHDSWWLIAGSGVFNIFVTCATMMLLIFMLLYMGIVHKTYALVEENAVKKETIEIRLKLLHRAAIIICGIIAMEVSSIFYINSSSTIFHYVFATICSILGFIIIIAYVVSGEIMLIAPIFRNLKWKPDLDDEQTSEPIKVCSKVSGEVENDAAPPQLIRESYLEVRGVAAGSIDMREYIAEPAPSYTNCSVPPANRFLPEIRIDHSEDINLESYSTSPRKYQEPMTFDPAFAGRSSHYSVEAYSANDMRTFRDFNKYGNTHEMQTQGLPQSVSPECSAKVLCSADVESRMIMGTMPDVTLAVKSDIELSSMEIKNRDQVSAIPDIANTTERKQPDGEEEAPEITITECETTASGMLDRISHDLDYLLNRTHTKEET